MDTVALLDRASLSHYRDTHPGPLSQHCRSRYSRHVDHPDAMTASDRHSTTLTWVEGFRAPEGDRARHSVNRTLNLLRRSPAPFARDTYDPGHITGSGLVFAPTMDRILLVLHDRLACWLQPGGHVEADDATVYETARREVHEETGVSVMATSPELIGVDVHEIPAARGEPAHLHHDLMFSMVATEETLRNSSETRAVVWCPLEELETYGVDQILSRNVARALSGLGKEREINPI
jgi:8-oxo-dGTP pyrophosphatase MutT (NUDIX family)